MKKPNLNRCSRPRCNKKTSWFGSEGRKHLCWKHYRFMQMRSLAAQHGKYVPSYEELDTLVVCLNSMKCPKCTKTMNWSAKTAHKTVITLQHYRNGHVGFLCFSCNSRHAARPDDSFMDAPLNEKMCSKCKNSLPLSCFNSHKGSRTIGKVASACRACGRQIRARKKLLCQS